ncbi:holliday junction resolvase [Microbacterium phage Theresita]|nr:holliday junction resolvase [Microbacterium phage Theresita]
MVMKGGKPALARDFGVRSRALEHARWRFLSIDPGDEHVGLAEFERKADGVWYCVWAGEMTPEVFLPWFVEGLKMDRWEHVVVESWHLFPESAKFYVGSDMPTSRLIGSITALAAYIPDEGAWFDDPVVVTLQSPQIKVPTRSILKRRKLRSVAKVLKVSGDHASDAELHGFKYLVDHKLTFENTTQQERRLAAEHPPLTHSHALW